MYRPIKFYFVKKRHFAMLSLLCQNKTFRFVHDHLAAANKSELANQNEVLNK